MVVGLVSSYREGALLGGAVASLLPGCDLVLVLEGHAAPGQPRELDNASQQQLAQLDSWPDVRVDFAHYGTDAEKRQHLLEWAQRRWRGKVASQGAEPEPLWCLWLDGDELLLWPEFLRDVLARAAQETAAGGVPLRIVELDGSVAWAPARVVRGDKVVRYLEGAYQLELEGGMVVALPNQPLCSAGGVPYRPDDVQGNDVLDPQVAAWLARHRPPLQGEPHVLHRALLRSTARQVQRLHELEPAWYERRQP